jgi:hypothetical protein
MAFPRGIRGLNPPFRPLRLYRALPAALFLAALLVPSAWANIDKGGKKKEPPAWGREITWKGGKVLVHREHVIVKFRAGVSESRRRSGLVRHSLELLDVYIMIVV